MLRAPGIRVSAYHGSSKSERERVLSRVQRKGGVCLTSYGMLTNHAELLAETPHGSRFVWVNCPTPRCSVTCIDILYTLDWPILFASVV